MAKSAPRFACQECGAVYPKWAGRCEACGAWNSLIEEMPRSGPPKSLGGSGGSRGSQGYNSPPLDFVALRGDSGKAPRHLTGIAELDRVCGGGLVPGSAILVGGDPGIGKSTLLLQAAAAVAASGGAAAYITGEEAIDQIRLRARRLGVADAPVRLAVATSVRDIAASLDIANPPQFAVIDSIQTMYLDTLDSAPGTVSQVRGAAQELIGLAKRRGIVLVLVGHVTKEGMIAGPRVLEHMVDTVLYFEGERGHQFRILRAVKNRYGATDEIGVFEMSDRGLVEVPNPSAMFLAERVDAEHGEGAVAGAAVFAGIEGTRPVLVEIQALVAPSLLGTPRRAVVGWDATRLAMIVAVLDARCGLSVGANDIYLNVAGGLRIGEPAADLAVAAALISAMVENPVPADTVVFGEIGLSGRVRPVSHSDARLKEAAKLGFTEAWLPARVGGRGAARGRSSDGIATAPIGHLSELVERLAPPERRRMRRVAAAP
ncbi:MAG TPA: DNA repair protein RadA [Stellaceae bacterium]|nr:DNA repair protein RadA [Stellaceae bacterium]